MFELPVNDREVACHYTLSAENLKWIDARHGPGNQLGTAVHLTVPSPVLRFLADQIHAPVAAFAEYARRSQTRLEHAGQLHQRLGLRSFARADIRHAVESATAAAWSTDKGGPIAQALMDALRTRNIILPSPATLERVGLAGRAQARRRAAGGLLARVSAEQSPTSTSCWSMIPS